MSDASEAYPAPETFVGVDGKTYEIRPLSINGMIKIEERYELESIEEAFQIGRLELQKPKNLRFLLWVIISEAHPDLKEDQAGSIVNVANLAAAQAAIVSAFTRGLPKGEVESEEEADSTEGPLTQKVVEGEVQEKSEDSRTSSKKKTAAS